jgi:DNA-binding transcriptional regulator of glucitol operon
MSMNRRRFMFLAVVLVALSTFFWLAQGGFALGGGLIQQFFGSRMIRAEVVVLNPDGSTTDERIDRGVIVAVTPALITLREADGTIAAIQTDPNAQVQGGARVSSVSRLRRNLRVVVYHQANAPAEYVQVEGVGP